MYYIISVMTPTAEHYFSNTATTAHKQYEALRAFFVEKRPAGEIASQFGYARTTFYALIRDFKLTLAQSDGEDPFFQPSKKGRKQKANKDELVSLIINCRKQYLSIPDIQSAMVAKGHKLSYGFIYDVVKQEGFSRLPKRNRTTVETSKQGLVKRIRAPISEALEFQDETFTSSSGGLLCLLPYLNEMNLEEMVKQCAYPGTSSINAASSILSFIALKASNVRRYSADDLWCMDRGLGLFAGLNVLPKTSWYSTYSHRITRQSNITLLKQMHTYWQSKGMLSDTINMDFTTIPYWGDDDHLENNWSGKKHTSLSSMLAVFAHDPETGIIDYSDSHIRHQNESKTVLEFLDFYPSDGSKNIKYLVFDSKFTTYQNLNRLDRKGVKFITIRRRGEKLVERLDGIDQNQWVKKRIMKANGKGRTLKVYEEQINVSLKKKRHLPILLDHLKKFEHQKISWLANRRLIFSGSSSS